MCVYASAWVIGSRFLSVNDVQRHIHQAAVIVVSPAYLDEEDLDLFARPPAASHQGTECDGLDSVEEDGAPIKPDGFEDLVLRPGANGYLQSSL